MSGATKQRARLDARQIGKHAKNCHAAAAFNRGTWDTVWGPLDRLDPSTFATSRLTLRKTRGQRGLNTYCLVFICNSTNCHAKLVVRADAVLHSVQGIPGVRSASRPEGRASSEETT